MEKFECKYCERVFETKRGLWVHKRNSHNEEQKKEIIKREEKQKLEREKDVFCLICNEKMDCLTQHVFYKHNITIDEYKKIYPFAKIQKDKRKKQNLCCEYCGKKYDYNNNLALHIKREHPEFYIKNNDKRKNGILCKICNKYYINFSQHVELKHKINFVEYRKKYNYNGKETFVTKEHKENLSKNKKIFYNETKRGAQLKEEQSNKISGKNNPACRFDVREKISRSAMNRVDNYKYASRGIHVSFKYNKIDYHVRSFIEFKTLIMLLENNIQFEYERERIYYIDKNGKSRYYYPDLLINNCFFEIKSKDNECIADDKYQIVFKLLQDSGRQIKMLSPESLAKELNLKLNNEDYYCSFAKKLLNENNIKFTWYSTCHSKSKILEKIDKNYLENKENFNVVLSKVEYGNKKGEQ